ncbi:hypothetical protein EAE99_001217 [Botrytis elliptica]|nr:hypothetical protein EAE99_001217 [Botrytis elliptica]
MHEHKPDLGDRWTQHQRRNNKTRTQSWDCTLCSEHTVFTSTEELWKHAEENHRDKFPINSRELQQFRKAFESDSAASDSAEKMPPKHESFRKKHTQINGVAEAERPSSLSKRPLDTPQPTRSLLGLQALNLGPQSDEYTIILQPETRPISQEQLVAEVKGIYAGLVMVEAKCIEFDNKQAGLGHKTNIHGHSFDLNELSVAGRFRLSTLLRG